MSFFLTGKTITLTQLPFGLQNNKITEKKTIELETIQQQIFSVHMKNQPSTFDRTSNFIINHIQKIYKNGNDIAETLHSMKKKTIGLVSCYFPRYGNRS